MDETLDYYSDDKVRTYCTEGTPYAFSTATSMSDLRASETDIHNNDVHKVCIKLFIYYSFCTFSTFWWIICIENIFCLIFIVIIFLRLPKILPCLKKIFFPFRI